MNSGHDTDPRAGSTRNVMWVGDDADAPAPADLDPMASAVLQRYVEAERQRSRRLLVWTATLLLFGSLLLFIVFVSIGIVVLGNSRRTAEAVNAVKAQNEVQAADVVNMGKRLGQVESAGEQVRKTVQQKEARQDQSDEVLKADLERFSRWIAANNARDGQWLSRLDMRVRELEEALKARDAEVAALKSRGGTERAGPAAAVAKGPGARDVPMQTNELPDTVSLDELTNTVFETAVTVVEGGPRGEISVVTFPNGDRYEGELKSGLCEGWGTYYYRNGDRFEGDFRNDMKHGEGNLHLSQRREVYRRLRARHEERPRHIPVPRRRQVCRRVPQ